MAIGHQHCVNKQLRNEQLNQPKSTVYAELYNCILFYRMLGDRPRKTHRLSCQQFWTPCIESAFSSAVRHCGNSINNWPWERRPMSRFPCTRWRSLLDDTELRLPGGISRSGRWTVPWCSPPSGSPDDSCLMYLVSASWWQPQGRTFREFAADLCIRHRTHLYRWTHYYKHAEISIYAKISRLLDTITYQYLVLPCGQQWTEA